MGNPATLTYSWTSPAGAVVSGAQTATLITNAPGIYTVAATSTISGCTASASAYVYECVGLEDNNAAPALRLFPNPVKDQLHFVNPVQSACKLSFSNTLGQVVHTLLLPQLPAQLSVEFLNAGVYYLECTSSSGSSVLKFYKE